ncbi:MAG: radical SAM protein [Rikenellaceae bacterium]
MSDIKLVWLDLNASYSHSSLALPMIEAQNDNSSIDWRVVFATLSSDVTTIVNDIIEQEPSVLVATAWLFTHDKLHQIVRRVKSILPNLTVIYGGPEFMGSNDEYLRVNTYVDCVVRGEGEEVFYQLIDNINDKSKWNDIDGLCAIINGEYIDGGIAKVKDFASLKYAETSQFFKFDKAFVQFETTRGCFNSCAFCVSGNDKPIRSISMEEVRKRLLNFIEKGIKDIRVLDRTFNYHKGRTSQFFNIFREFSDVLRFHLEIHPALLTDEMCDELSTMPKGLLHLEAGVQSLNENVLKACNRGGTKDKTLKGLRFLCDSNNLECHADLIIGLPLYTLEQVYLDVRQLVEIGADEIQLETLKLLPGTPLRRDASKLGIRYSPLAPYEVLKTEDISVSEIAEATILSKMLDNFYNHSLYKDVISKLVINEHDFTKKFTISLLDKLGMPLTPTSRGELLYTFCKEHYPQYLPEITKAWIYGGLSMKREAAHSIEPHNGELPENLSICLGDSKDVTRFYVVKYPEKHIYFGFNRKLEHSAPIFIAETV